MFFWIALLRWSEIRSPARFIEVALARAAALNRWLKERIDGPLVHHWRDIAGFVVDRIGDVLYFGWIHPHFAGAGAGCDSNSRDPGTTADPINVNRHVLGT
jgi:hypothetical protein